MRGLQYLERYLNEGYQLYIYDWVIKVDHLDGKNKLWRIHLGQLHMPNELLLGLSNLHSLRAPVANPGWPGGHCGKPPPTRGVRLRVT
jgi:hypothetical protein